MVEYRNYIWVTVMCFKTNVEHIILLVSFFGFVRGKKRKKHITPTTNHTVVHTKQGVYLYKHT